MISAGLVAALLAADPHVIGDAASGFQLTVPARIECVLVPRPASPVDGCPVIAAETAEWLETMSRREGKQARFIGTSIDSGEALLVFETSLNGTSEATDVALEGVIDSMIGDLRSVGAFEQGPPQPKLELIRVAGIPVARFRLSSKALPPMPSVVNGYLVPTTGDALFEVMSFGVSDQEIATTVVQSLVVPAGVGPMPLFGHSKPIDWQGGAEASGSILCFAVFIVLGIRTVGHRRRPAT